MFTEPHRRTLFFVLIVVFSILSSTVTFARDSEARFSIDTAMQTSTAKSFTDVKFFFGDQAHPAVNDHLGTFDSRRTTNAFAKSDQESCQWAFLSGIKSLYQRALTEGGDAVINIRSVTTGQSVTSQTDYVCRAGNVVSKVYLEGDVVRLHSSAGARSSSTRSSIVQNPGNPDVQDAQTTLNGLGLDAGTADGVMGPRTETAIRNFQKISGLPATGILDEKTLAKLRSVQSANN